MVFKINIIYKSIKNEHMGKKRILHICLANYYYDKVSYQENMLVKKHIEFGYEVKVVSFCNDMVNGKVIVRKPGLYLGQFGEPIYRLQTKEVKGLDRFNLFAIFSNYHEGLFNILNEYKPNIIFVHGAQTKNVYEIIKYKKESPDVVVFADNHADRINQKRGIKHKHLGYFLKNQFYGKYARDLSKVVKVFWGTTPARCDFLIKTYHVDSKKVSFLPTGVDEKKINQQGKRDGENLLKRYGVHRNDFIIVTGGKFDKYKNIIPLVDSYVELRKKHYDVVLVIFGTLENEYLKYIQNKQIVYLGWLNDTSIVNILMNANLCVFTGGHSTLWEEAIAVGVPGIFMKYKGFEHINFHENVIFLEQNEKEDIFKILETLLKDKRKYKQLKNNALNSKRRQFFYSEISKKAIS